jgi:mycofactocin precursor peptide peptidase
MPGRRVSPTVASWPDLAELAVLLVPVGSYEQHGPHLPLDTDATIATAVAQRAAAALSGSTSVHVGPPIAYGASGEHQDFPGTLSIGTEALRVVLIEFVRSASTWSARTIFVNGHGGNLAALRLAARQLRDEGHDVAWVVCAVPGGDAHAGHVETSVMLRLAPDRVDLSRARAGNCESLDRLMPTLVTQGVRAVAPNGVLGDPTGATGEAGAHILTAMVDDVVARIRHGRPGPDGRLLLAEVRRR